MNDPEQHERLSMYALGLLEAEDVVALQAELAASAPLRAELAAIHEALEDVGRSAGAIAPSAAARRRLMDALDSPAERFGPFLTRLARRLDLSVEAMRERLEAALAPATAWSETGVPGVRFVHFEAGPALAGADTGFVRFDGGAAFPGHVHHGPELTFVLEGTLRFSTGEVLRPGDAIVVEGGRRHHVEAPDPEGCLYVTFHHGFDVEGA